MPPDPPPPSSSSDPPRPARHGSWESVPPVLLPTNQPTILRRICQYLPVPSTGDDSPRRTAGHSHSLVFGFDPRVIPTRKKYARYYLASLEMVFEYILNYHSENKT